MIEICLLAARTARSVAYAQALRNRGVEISTAVIFGGGGEADISVPERARERGYIDSPLFIPNLNEPLDDVSREIAKQVIYLETSDVNDPSLVHFFIGRSETLIVYSGYGGQIVGAPLINLGLPLLHIHAGWLPEFRGSTTIYYEMLARRACSASALLLTEGIDEGPVIARKRFAPPPGNLDIDYLYDPAIRADLLCDVLEGLVNTGSIGEPVEQSHQEAQTYYIIHPLLKHLAILGKSLEAKSKST